MNWLKDWAIHLLILGCVLSIFLGYFWRMIHEKKNWDKWVDAIRQEFMLEVTNDRNPQMVQFKNWVFIKQADGSVVIKRR